MGVGCKMVWHGEVEKWFVGHGFQTEWIWMGRDKSFFLAWKGRMLAVHFVEPEDFRGPEKPMAVKKMFLELFSHLRYLESWDRVFKGREISFKWLSLRRLADTEIEILKAAGVEPFRFEPYTDYSSN